MIHTLLTEFIEPSMEISTPFLAHLGNVPIQVWAVLELTAVYSIIGRDRREVARHDLIFVDGTKLRKRPIDAKVLQQRLSRERGRLNRLLARELY